MELIERLPVDFKVIDANRQSLATSMPAANTVLAMDEPRRLASNFAKLAGTARPKLMSGSAPLRPLLTTPEIY